MNKWTAEELQAGQIFLIDKPLDWTSFDVVKKLKNNIQKQLGIRKLKVGHAGTLDPRATGLLIVCVGKATKQISSIQEQRKVYTGTFKLGATTPSYDTETEEENLKAVAHFSLDQLQDKTMKFVGPIMQVPPVFSAVKKEGKRAYEAARKGIDLKLDPRAVEVYRFEITQVALPFVSFHIECSKGTYIRSLAHDFGDSLGSGAYLYTLRRERIGDYSVDNAQNDALFDSNYFSSSEE